MEMSKSKEVIMTRDAAFHPPNPSGSDSHHGRLADFGLAVVCAVVLLGGLLFVGWSAMAGAASSARPVGATSFCDPSVEDCGPQPEVLFAQLNSDITTLFPPIPTAPQVLRLATQAENAFPLQPNAPSDFCPSFGQFGALENFVVAKSQDPTVTPSSVDVILGDIGTIRSAPIWNISGLPPSPCISG
jgi:hypothetical protein